MSCCKGSIPTVELEDWPGEASVLSRFRLYMWTWRKGPQTQLEPGKNGTSFFLSFMDGDGRVRVEGRGCGGEDEGGRDCHNCWQFLDAHERAEASVPCVLCINSQNF